MKPTNGVPGDLQSLLHVWARPQLKLPGVPRWKKYVRQGCRPQNTLQHSYSIELFGIWLFPRLRTYVRFNEYLVLSALLLHDLGEGEVGGDTHYIDKNLNQDVAEWTGFAYQYAETLGSESRDAFLLQFFPKWEEMGLKEEVSDGMKRWMYLKGGTEYFVFTAIERFDYVLYALEQYLSFGRQKILVQVLRNQLEPFEKLCTQLPGFREVLWTTEFEAWCRDFLAPYEGKWIEQKGET